MAEPQGTPCSPAAGAVPKEPTPDSKEETPFVIKNPKGDCIRFKLHKNVNFNNVAFKIYSPIDEETDESAKPVKFGKYEFEPFLLDNQIRSFDHKKYLRMQGTKSLMIRLFSKIYVPIESGYETNDDITELRGDSTEWPLVLLKRLDANKEYDFNKMIPQKMVSRLFDRNGDVTDQICAHHVLQYDYVKPRQCVGLYKCPDVHIEGVHFFQQFHENHPWLADPALLPFFYVFPCSNTGYKTNTPTQFDFFYENMSKTLTNDQTKLALEDYFLFKMHIDYLNQKLIDLRSLLEIDPITTGRLYTKNENKSTSDWIVAMNTLYPHNHTKRSQFFIGDCLESKHKHNDYSSIIPHCENNKDGCNCVICQNVEAPEYNYEYNKSVSALVESINRRCNIILNTMHVTMLKLQACRELLIRNGIIQTVNLDKYLAAEVYFHLQHVCKTDINDCSVKITNFHPQARTPNYRIDDPVAIAEAIKYLIKINERRTNYVKRSAAALKSKATYLMKPCTHFPNEKESPILKPYYLEIFNTPHTQISKDDHKLIAYNIYNKQGKTTSELFVKKLTERICNDIELNLHFDPMFIDEDPEFKPKKLETHLPSFQVCPVVSQASSYLSMAHL